MFKNIPIKTIDNGHEQQYDNEQLVSMIHDLMDERDVLWRENEYLKAKLNESVLIETINEMRKERDLLLKLLLNLTSNNKTEQSPYQNSYTDEHTNGYSNDVHPPSSSYQTFNTNLNGKLPYNINSPNKKLPTHSRHSQHLVTNHDVSIPVTELKSSSRRLHRNKQNSDQQPSVVYRVEGTKECLMNPNELSSVFAHVKHSHPNKKIVVYKTSTTPHTHEFNQLVDEMCIKHGVELKHSQNSPFQQYRSRSLQDLTSTNTTTSSSLIQPDFDFQFQPIEIQEQIRGNYTKK
ncbi:unnamed protein product [Adineta steineri]|uniref:Uncharacterized protein n=1 Tax=Adineta steineri TaxID=433720 RepID=A0A818WCJ5_9BILA|nr:unnamed protein product [Adineta steineri]CAF3723659.1 unnamed protein product [Adineta steineri]